MSTSFKLQCINYLLVRGWLQDPDGEGWAVPFLLEPHSFTYRETLGQALDTQLEWDDEGPN